jgi:Rubisco Assembly chaperone C-terminal domain/Rubisco accumulation factor 1 alpha helical domain/Rubisco accumulation factor 1 helix turn helix domain
VDPNCLLILVPSQMRSPLVMTDFPTAPDNSAPIDSASLFLMLRRKQENWVAWGQACQQLQKAGHSPQAIFEETGFEPIQQNQIMVASQVYLGLVQANAPSDVLEHFQQRSSDILYEFRILTQSDRVDAIALALHHNLDSDEAHDIAKTLKDFSRLSKVPEAFTTHPGDAVAHQCWTQARQKSDLQERSRLIAKGLKYAHTSTARKELERLLTDFSVVKTERAPRLPMYRLESELELPRILPLMGKLPLPTEALKAVPMLEEDGPFRVVQFAGEGAWVPLPGWQVLMSAEDPIAMLCPNDRLPSDPNQAVEDVMVVVDRAQREWDNQSYFVVDAEGELDVQWYPEEPSDKILGRVLLVVRPKRIFDEEAIKELWSMDE